MEKDEIRNELLSLGDESYKSFHSKLIPNVPKESIIGIRTPDLRKYAKELFKKGGYEDFLNDLPHRYYDENNLHSFLISQIKDFDLCMCEIKRFLPFVDNWAVCDMLKPVSFSKNKDKLSGVLLSFLNSEDTYTIRFSIVILMSHYLEKDFDEKYLKAVGEIVSEEYYVNMAVAWYFATALAKQYDKTIPYIENKYLPKWTHNKAIQKAIESSRISNKTKIKLRNLKI